VVAWSGAIVEISVVQHADIIISHARAHRKIFSKSNPPSSFLLPPFTTTTTTTTTVNNGDGNNKLPPRSHHHCDPHHTPSPIPPLQCPPCTAKYPVHSHTRRSTRTPARAHLMFTVPSSPHVSPPLDSSSSFPHLPSSCPLCTVHKVSKMCDKNWAPLVPLHCVCHPRCVPSKLERGQQYSS
jgi:hypothetical protein